MYRPPAFAENREDVLLDLVSTYPLGMISWVSDGQIETTPLPFVIAPTQDRTIVLQAHLPRANPLASLGDQGTPALITFSGPQAYISPSWYPTKRLTGRVVPTWNYAVVTARGPVSVVDNGEWVRRQMARLTAQQEAGRAEPWSMDDAPLDYTEALVRSLVGLEMTVEALGGKWKVSQNQPAANRVGVATGLREQGSDTAEQMARLVEGASRVEA